MVAKSRRWPVDLPNLLWNCCDALMVIDQDRRVLATNGTLDEWVKGRATEALGTIRCDELLQCGAFSGKGRGTSGCPAEVGRKQGTSVQSAECVLHCSGGRRVVSGSFTTTLLPGDGQRSVTLVVLRDVTALKRREQRVAHDALTDELTGLLNRRGLLRIGAKHVGRAVRTSRPLAVGVVDLDGFKAFNDRHGHPAGDEVIRATARALADVVGGRRLAARFGGDEFAALWLRMHVDEALSSAERLRADLEAALAPVCRRAAVSAGEDAATASCVSASIGLAVFPEDGRSIMALLSRADARLYAAKRQGRNRVVGPETRGG